MSDGAHPPALVPGDSPETLERAASSSAAADPTSEAPPSRRRHLTVRLLQIALIAATAYFIVDYLARYWSSVTDYDWSIEPAWLLLSVTAFLAFYLSQAAVWVVLLRGLGMACAFWPAASIWARSILARYVPGSVFMFVGRAWMHHSQGLPIERVSAAMVYEQALGLASALVTVAILFPFWEYRPGVTAVSLAAIPILVALMHPRIFVPLADRLLRLAHRQPLGVSLPFGRVLVLMGYFVCAWLVCGFGAWALARGVAGLDIASLPLVIVGYAFAYVVGMVAFVFPSGLGVREVILGASLAGRLPGGVALAWALLLRVWVTVLELLFVGLTTLREAVARRRETRLTHKGE